MFPSFTVFPLGSAYKLTCWIWTTGPSSQHKGGSVLFLKDTRKKWLNTLKLLSIAHRIEFGLVQSWEGHISNHQSETSRPAVGSEELLNMVKYLVLTSFIFVLLYKPYFHKVGLFLLIPTSSIWGHSIPIDLDLIFCETFWNHVKAGRFRGN